MAPHAVDDYARNGQTDTIILKAKAVVHHTESEESSLPPVADNYMYDFKYNHPLPTSDVLGLEIPDDCDAQKEASIIVARLSDCFGAGDAESFADLFLESGKLLHCRMPAYEC